MSEQWRCDSRLGKAPFYRCELHKGHVVQHQYTYVDEKPPVRWDFSDKERIQALEAVAPSAAVSAALDRLLSEVEKTYALNRYTMADCNAVRAWLAQHQEAKP